MLVYLVLISELNDSKLCNNFVVIATKNYDVAELYFNLFNTCLKENYVCIIQNEYI